MKMRTDLLLGIDGGGTYTRVAITDTEGKLLSYLEWKGGAFLHKDANAKENVHSAVFEAVKQANGSVRDIVGMAAGIAGYDKKIDWFWVRKVTAVKGLKCPSRLVNDAVIAQKGAFLSKPGIIAIAGTGSVIAGIAEKGRFIRNYDFKHYANNAARCLSYNSIDKIIAGDANPSDTNFIARVLQYFSAKDISSLKELQTSKFAVENIQRDKLFGDFAPVVTDAALNGSELAKNVCMQAAKETVAGIRLLGDYFELDEISVALIGSVINSRFIKNAVYEMLCEKGNKKYLLSEPSLPPVLGAILMAMQLNNIELNEQRQSNLSSVKLM